MLTHVSSDDITLCLACWPLELNVQPAFASCVRIAVDLAALRDLRGSARTADVECERITLKVVTHVGLFELHSVDCTACRAVSRTVVFQVEQLSASEA